MTYLTVINDSEEKVVKLSLSKTQDSSTNDSKLYIIKNEHPTEIIEVDAIYYDENYVQTKDKTYLYSNYSWFNTREFAEKCLTDMEYFGIDSCEMDSINQHGTYVYLLKGTNSSLEYYGVEHECEVCHEMYKPTSLRNINGKAICLWCLNG